MASDAKQHGASLEDILKGPAMTPPSGQVSNFVDPDTHSKVAIIIFSTSIIFSSFFVIARMYTKLFIIRKVHKEDYACVLGYLFFLAYWIVCVYVVKNGGGKHQWNVRVEEFIDMMFWVYVGAILYPFVFFFVKCSICLQYLRIFPAVRKRELMYWGPYAVIYANALFWVGTLPVQIGGCNPRKKYWDVLQPGHCVDWDAFDMTTGIFNAVSDVVVLLIPQYTIWKLQMPLMRKLSVSAIFLVGTFACASSAVRVYYSKVSLTYDTSYNVTTMGWWIFAEMCASIISGCMPILPKFFKTTQNKLFSYVLKKSTGKSRMEYHQAEKQKPPRLHILNNGINGRYHSFDDQESGLAQLSERREDENSTAQTSERTLP